MKDRDIEKKIKFLEKMFKREKEDFNNKFISNSTKIPDDVKKSLSGLDNEMGEWIKELRKEKFEYYLYKSEKGKVDAREFFLNAKESEEKEIWEKYLDIWDKMMDYDEIAYVSRLFQHRFDYDLVQKKWYPHESNPFQKWAQSQFERIYELWEKYNPLNSEENFEELHSNFQIGETDIYLRTVYSCFQKKIFDALFYKFKVIAEYLACNSSEFKSDDEDSVNEDEVVTWIKELLEFISTEELSSVNKDYGYFIDKSTLEVFKELVKKIYESDLGKEEAIYQFLNILKSHDAFHCDVCDFMEVTTGPEGEGKPQVTLSTSTVPREREQDRQSMVELKKQESYRKGEGITGSIFLAPEDKNFFHVGSDLLEQDYRQSEEQKSHYEKFYEEDLEAGDGKLCNFCAFPIYDDDKNLQYVLRVVNRTASDEPKELHERAWDTSTKLQLHFLTRLVGCLLLCISADLIGKLRESLQLEWMEEQHLRTLIEHLEQVALSKSEDRNLGCTVAILGQNSVKNLEYLKKATNSHIQLSSDIELDEMSDYYDAVESEKCCFIFDDNLKIVEDNELKVFDSKDEMFEALEGFTVNYHDSIAFHVEKGHRVIKIVTRRSFEESGSSEENEYGEIYFCEARGSWAFRDYNKILSDVHPYVNEMEEQDLDKVLELAYCLTAKGLGGLIVVDDTPEKVNYKGGDIKLKDPSHPSVKQDKDLLVSLAKLDGAMIMDKNGSIEEFGATINYKKIEEEGSKTNSNRNSVNHQGELPDEVKNILKTSGHRHKAGVLTSFYRPNALVLVISENRIITALSNLSKKKNIDGEYPQHLCKRF